MGQKRRYRQSNWERFTDFLVRKTLSLLVIAGMLTLVFVIFPRVFPPDPKTVRGLQGPRATAEAPYGDYAGFFLKARRELAVDKLTIDEARDLFFAEVDRARLTAAQALPPPVSADGTVPTADPATEPIVIPDNAISQNYPNAFLITDGIPINEKSRGYVAERTQQFIQSWNGKYWVEGERFGIQCVGGMKKFMEVALHLDFSYIRGVKYLAWAPSRSEEGYPPWAVEELLQGAKSIIDPAPAPDNQFVHVEGYGRVKYHVVLLRPEHADKLEVGDILIFGTSGNLPGHTGIFTGYPDGPTGARVTVFDQNGETGKGSPTADYFRFHTWQKSWLNDQIIAVRIVYELP